MINIIITKKEIEECQEDARKATRGEGVYAYYKKRNGLYNDLLIKKSGFNNVAFDLNGGDLMYHDDRIPNVHPAIIQKIVREEGFTAEEYSALTGEPVPNQWYNELINVDDETGKVHRFEQNGNISIMMGAPVFSKKYKHLVKTVWTKCTRVSVEIV